MSRPPSRSLTVIPLPIRPRPIIPTSLSNHLPSESCFLAAKTKRRKDAGSVRGRRLRARLRTRRGAGLQPARKCEAGGRGLPSNVLQSAARDATAALLEGFEVARRLCADQPREPERLAGNRKLLALIVDDLQEPALFRAALVQLAGRVQVARAEPVRADAACLPPRPLDQR